MLDVLPYYVSVVLELKLNFLQIQVGSSSCQMAAQKTGSGGDILTEVGGGVVYMNRRNQAQNNWVKSPYILLFTLVSDVSASGIQ